MGDKETAAWGIGVSGYATVAVSLITTSVYLWLVAQLVPAELGIVTTGYSIYLMLFLFKDFGLTPAIVSQRNITQDFLVSAYTLRVCVMLVLTAIGLVLSLTLPEITNIQEFRWIALLVVFSLLAEAMGFLSAAMLQRNLAFSALARLDVMTAGVSGVTAVIVALGGYPVLALFAGIAASSIVRTVTLLRLSPFRARFSFKTLRAHGLLSFGSQLFVIRGASYAVLNLNVFVLSSMDMTALGFYGLAAQWATKPSDMSSVVINRVMLPTYSSVVRKGRDVFGSYLRTTTYLSFLSFGILCLLVGFAPLFIDTVYGPAWSRSIPILEILLVFGLMRTLAEPAGSLLVAVGRPGIYMWSQILSLGIMSCMILPVADAYGAIGCATLLSAVFLIHLCVLWTVIASSFDRSITAILRASWRPSASALAALTVGLATYLFIHVDWIFLVLTLEVPLMYLAVLRVVANDELRSAFQLFRRVILLGR